MTSKELVEKWVEAFNKADPESLANLYHKEAVNHQVNTDPVKGRDNIKQMFSDEFSRAKMICQIENIFQDGDWAILEWKDPLGLRGCGIFQVKNDQIIFQRGYWDKLSFLKLHDLPIPLD